MIRCALALSCLILLSSCATLLNQDTTQIHFRTKEPAKVSFLDTTLVVEKRAVVRVPRSADSLKIAVEQGGNEKELSLPAQKSLWYYYNVFNLGVGFIWDNKSDRRFEYPEWINLDNTEGPFKKRDYYTADPGTIKLGFSLPYINSFYFQPEGEPAASSFGFFGLSAQLEYYYSRKRFLALNVGLAADFPVPVPASVNEDGVEENLSTIYFSLTNNHELGRFTVGYGINYSANNWNRDINGPREILELPDDLEEVTKISSNWGLVLNSYHRMGKNFYIGLVYRPSFIKLNASNTFEYEHSISIDLLWKWRIIRGKSK